MWKKESLGYPIGITLQPNHVDSSVRLVLRAGKPSLKNTRYGLD